MIEAPALPPILSTIAAVAGIDVAIRIAQQHGGRRVTIPTLADGSNWLTDLVGEELAARIISELGPARRVDLPLPPNGSSWRQWWRERNRRIAELEAHNASASEIARELGMTTRAVHFRRAKRRQRQADLFGGET